MRTGSFRRAAVDLHMAQPSVSMHVANLEQALGITLIARSTRGSTLTEAGHDMLSHLRAMLRAEASTEQQAAAVLGNRVGTVRIAGVNSAVTGLLPEVVSRVAIAHPELNVEVSELTSQGVTDGTRDGTFDLGIAAHPLDANLGLETELLASGVLVMVAHDEHPLLEFDSLCREDFIDEPFVTVRTGYSLREVALRYLDPVIPRIVGEALNQDTVRRLVGARLGVSIMPSSTLLAVGPDVGLAVRPLSDSSERIDVTLLHAGDLGSPSTHVVADAVRQVARRLYRKSENRFLSLYQD